MLGKRDEQEEEHREREAHQRVLHRMDRQPPQEFDQHERGEGEAEEEKTVLRGSL